MQINRETVAIVTGASSGIGAAVARKLAAQGAKVALAARSEGKLKELATEIGKSGGQALVVPTDVTDPRAARRLVEQTEQKFGAVDILVNNAGAGSFGSVEDTTPELVAKLFALNVFSLWYTTGAALPGMKKRKRGHVVTMASFSGKVATPFNAVYIAAKHAAIGFSSALRTELVDTGVEATAICPVSIATEWGQKTEGGSIGLLYWKAVTATNQGDNPVFAVLPPERVADAVLESVLRPGKPEVYIHEGSEDFVGFVARDLRASEEQMAPFFRAMRAAYQETRKK